MNTESQKTQSSIQVGISSCLLGEKVRFDGNHKHRKFITDELGKLFSYVPVCPEMAIGMGVPRAPIRLADDRRFPKAIGVYDKSYDVTMRLVNFSKNKATQLQNISGYIFKKGSPSCGMERVKIYSGKDLLSTQGVGLFAKEVMAANPLLPVEEEGRLNDQEIRDNFVQRVHVYHRWQQVIESGINAKKLVNFHTRHKFILLAHHEITYRELGRVIAKLGKQNISQVANEYIAKLMGALARKSTRGKHTNVLQHIMGFLKTHMEPGDKQEMVDVIGKYRDGVLPLVVPLMLLRHYLRRHPSNYIRNQYYMEAEYLLT